MPFIACFRYSLIHKYLAYIFKEYLELFLLNFRFVI